MSAPARYVALLLGLCGVMLGATLALSLALGARTQGSPAITRLASEWQERTHGVTYAPPLTHSRPFKALRLADRLSGIDTMVLGSSSVMGITEPLFEPAARVYNLGLTANATGPVTGEAEYLERHLAHRVRRVVIGLDWALGFMYPRSPVPVIDLSPSSAAADVAAPEVPWLARVRDALSRPRLAQLARVLRRALASGHPVASLQAAFAATAGQEYRCADGELARDFDVTESGRCRGFRTDGSFTFGGERRLTPARAATLARAAAVPSSKFAAPLLEHCGEPNPEYLRRLGAFARRFTAGGGEVVFLLPPLVPGLERQVLAAPGVGECLARTKSVIGEWAAAHGVVIVDAGQSERFGCEAGEFLDENHAFPECHGRVLRRFRADLAARRVAPGLYPGERR